MGAWTRRDTPTRARWAPLPALQLAFLVLFAAAGNVSEACRQLKVGRNTVYVWRENEPDFAAAWADAGEMASDNLEQFVEGVIAAAIGTDQHSYARLRARVGGDLRPTS